MGYDGIEIQWRPASVTLLQEKLKGFGNEMRNKYVDDAIYAAALLVLNRAQTKVPVHTGRLKASLTRRRVKDPDYIGTKILARRSKGFTGGFYAHLVERGHKQIIRTRKGLDYRGFYPARPYLRPAIEETREQVVDLMASIVSAKVAAYNRRQS